MNVCAAIQKRNRTFPLEAQGTGETPVSRERRVGDTGVPPVPAMLSYDVRPLPGLELIAS